jgi:hypothetical protein
LTVGISPRQHPGVPETHRRRRGAALVLALAVAMPAVAIAHVTESGCETESVTFLLCETAKARDASCLCEGQKVGGCGAKVGRFFNKTRVSLLKALRAVNEGDAQAIAKNVTRARDRIEQARERSAKLLERRGVEPKCRNAAAVSIESLKLWIALEFGDTTIPTTTTTSTTTPGGPGVTTTTSLPLETSCFGDLALYPIDMTQVTFAVWCNQAMSAFTVTLPGGRTILEHEAPLGFTCGQPTPGTYRCDGTLPADLWVRGRVKVDPAPVTGMGGQITGYQDTVAYGPFPLVGP